MTGRRGIPLVLLAALGLFYLLASSCAVLEKGEKSPSPVRPASSVTATALETPVALPVYDPGPVIKEARASMAKGEYEKAVEAYKGALSLHPGNKRLVSGCRDSLLAANGAAGTSFGKGDFGKAGSLYYLVAENYRYLGPAPIKAGYLKAGFLKKRVSDCGAALTQRGLESYRKGDLKAAISEWEAVLRFDPGNTEVKKAVATARVQLKKLSK